MTNAELIQAARDTRAWLCTTDPSNIAVLDQVRAAVRTVLIAHDAIPQNEREALLLTLGALFLATEALEIQAVPPAISRIYTLASLAELLGFCEDRVGEYLTEKASGA